MRQAVPILMYHSIADVDRRSRFHTWTVSPAVFASHMQYLADQQYETLTVSQLVALTSGGNPAPLPRRTVVLTFDDGFGDFSTNALPVLTQHGFTATLYVVTGYVGASSSWLAPMGEGARRTLTWDELAEAAASGIECGGHTHTHPVLDTLTTAAARDEIARCKAMLEDYLAGPIHSFAYPYGYYSARVRQMVQDAGYTSACAVGLEVSQAGDDPFSLRRLLVREDTSVAALGQMLERQGPTPGDLMRRARAPLVTGVRRWLARTRPYEGRA